MVRTVACAWLALWLTGASSMAAAPSPTSPPAPPAKPFVLQAEKFRHYVDRFNRLDRETVVQHIPNAAAWDWMVRNVPLFECPDKDIEETYYFRWWTYRKHIKQTPDGFVITEFLPNVGWAGKHNTISCAAGHHLYEGRWLRDPRYLDDYSVFWFRKGGEPRRYSFWAGRRHLRPLPGQRQQGVRDRPAARPGPQLRGMGEGTPRPERPVLADRRPRRHGGLHRRQRLPGHDQQLHVRRRHGDSPDRGRARRSTTSCVQFSARRPTRLKQLRQTQTLGCQDAQFFKVLPRGEKRATWPMSARNTALRPGTSTCPDATIRSPGSN